MGYEPEGKRQHIFTFLLCFLTGEFEARCIEECLKTFQIGCEILRLDPREQEGTRLGGEGAERAEQGEDLGHSRGGNEGGLWT